jgi:FlaA1/EpsC-like NDP-sugar epimerase
MFSVVRYGNVMGSRGSVIPYFISLLDKKKLTITDPSMTRFMITLEEGVQLVWHALEDMCGGEVYVKKIPSMKVTDVAKAISHSDEYDIVGIRPGEKIHEQMIGVEDSANTYEYTEHYKILPSIVTDDEQKLMIKDGEKVHKDFVYSSDKNNQWMDIPSLQEWINNNKNIIGKI